MLFPLYYPLAKRDFKGIVDLVKIKQLFGIEENMGSTFDVVDIPDDMKSEVEKYRANLIEAVAKYDDNLLEKFLKILTLYLKTRFMKLLEKQPKI